MAKDVLAAPPKDPVNGKYVPLTENQQEWIRIYHAYFVLQWETYEICEHFQCSPNKVSQAVRWVIANKEKFSSLELVAGAIYTIRERLKINRKLLDDELKKTKGQDKRFIIELNNQIRFDEDRLFKLQQIAAPDKDDKDKGINASDVLKLISAAKDA